MSVLVVDRDGSEWVWNYRPLRNKHRGRWESPYSEEGEYQCVELPNGSIEKLIGKILTWGDEPYEMGDR
jgi:hypothetical protein